MSVEEIDPISTIHHPKEENDQPSSKNRPSATAIVGLLTSQHLLCLTIAILLAAIGTITLEDISFVAFSIIYIYFLSKVAFPIPESSPSPTPVFSKNEKIILGRYVLVGAVIGLFIPIGYILEGIIIQGDKEGIKAACPHLFLLACQVFMEGVTFTGGFSLPITVFVPVFYNSWRIMSIMDWIRAEIFKSTDIGISRGRVYVGVGISILNLGFWCFNLFGFLLPLYLPRASKKYFKNLSD